MREKGGMQQMHLAFKSGSPILRIICIRKCQSPLGQLLLGI